MNIFPWKIKSSRKIEHQIVVMSIYLLKSRLILISNYGRLLYATPDFYLLPHFTYANIVNRDFDPSSSLIMWYKYFFSVQTVEIKNRLY